MTKSLSLCVCLSLKSAEGRCATVAGRESERVTCSVSGSIKNGHGRGTCECDIALTATTDASESPSSTSS